MNGIFRVCFYLLFAHSKQITEAIRDKRKELDEKNMDVNMTITMIKKRLKVVDGKLDKLADALLGGMKIEYIIKKQEGLESDRKELLEELTRLERLIVNDEEKFQVLLEDYKENTLLEFIHAESPKRREIYIKMMKSAIVIDRTIRVEYDNNMRFVFPVKRNKSREVFENFEVSVYYKDKYQYTIQANAVTENFAVKETVVVEKKPGATVRDELFVKAKFNRLSREVEELYKKVEELKGVKKVVGD